MVKVGSAGYRKLITSGGTPSGWVAYEAARPETLDQASRVRGVTPAALSALYVAACRRAA